LLLKRTKTTRLASAEIEHLAVTRRGSDPRLLSALLGAEED
jgi:hypothetical protein